MFENLAIGYALDLSTMHNFYVFLKSKSPS